MSANSFKPLASGDESVTLGRLSQLTGFPEEFIKKELILEDGETLTLPLLREKVIRYLGGIYAVEGDQEGDVSDFFRRKCAS